MWIGSMEDLTLEDCKSFFFNVEKVKNNLKRKITAVIWLVPIWSLWLLTNDFIFNQVVPIFDDCISAIVFRLWIWL